MEYGARGWIRTNDDNRFCRPTASTTHPHVHFNKKETSNVKVSSMKDMLEIFGKQVDMNILKEMVNFYLYPYL